MPQAGCRHAEEIAGYRQIGLGDEFEAAALHQADGGVHDRLRGEAMVGSDLEAEDVVGEVKGADLAAAVGEQLVAPYRAGYDLVDVIGRLLLAENLRALFVAEFIQIESGGDANLGTV